MDRNVLVAMAELQLRDARDFRKWAIYYRLFGHTWLSEAYQGRAQRCVRCAKLFMADAHTEQWPTLHMHKGPKQ
ncbi:MAG TPA: hypothetical protein DCS42_12345 [Nitrospiraceae bacterium]|nr:hypothetical protein [Nitrospiraceae bacterium]